MLKKKTYLIPNIENETQAKQLETMLTEITGVSTVKIDLNRQKITVVYETLVIPAEIIDSQMKQYGLTDIKDENKKQNERKTIRLVLVLVAWILFMLIHWMYVGNPGMSPIISLIYLIFVLFVHVYLAMPLHKAFFKSLRENRYSLDSHLTIGLFFLFVQNVYNILIGANSLYVAYSLGIVSLYNIIQHMMGKPAFSKVDAIDFLAKRIPAFVSVERKGKQMSVPSSEMAVGDCIEVATGDFFPADGEIVKGETTANHNIITGINEEFSLQVGDSVFQGVRNLTGDVTIRVVTAGNNTKLKNILEILEQIKTESHRKQNTVDTIVVFYAMIYSFVSVFMFVFMCIFDEPLNALFYTGMAITGFCTPALMIVPLVIHLVGRRIYNAGALRLMNLDQIEELADVSAVVFDTKGVLTKGTHEVVRVYSLGSYTENQILSLACSVLPDEIDDPDFSAVLNEKQNRKIENDWNEFSNVLLGTIEFMEEQGVFVQDAMGIAQKHEKNGQVALAVALDNQIVGIIIIGDALRPEAQQVTATLNNMSLRPYVISTEPEKVVKNITNKLSVGHVILCKDVAEKCDRILQIRRLGSVVATAVFSEREMPIVGISNVGLYFSNEMNPGELPGDVLCASGKLTQLPFAIETARRVRKNVELAIQIIVILSVLLLIAAFFGLPLTQTVLFVFGLVQVFFVSALAIVLMHKNKKEERI